MNKNLLVALCLVLGLNAVAAELSGEEFLRRTRRQSEASSYAMLEGIVQHLKDGGKMIEKPVYLGVLITAQGSRAQLIIDGVEAYDIRQTRQPDGGAETRVTPYRRGGYADAMAANFRLDPADLTTGFLFYDLIREEEPERVKGIACRVFSLKNPHKDESVRVYIAKEYFFPLKAEFFNAAAPTGKPDKTLATASFQEKNNLYYAELINLHGPGWRTRVHFESAKVGISEPGAEFQIFKKINEPNVNHGVL
jgi:hypothetical protein